MEALADFQLFRPTTLDEVLKVRTDHPDGRLLGGGTDLLVNIRRGIVAPESLIDITDVKELRAIHADAQRIEIGAAVTLAEVAAHPRDRAALPRARAGRGLHCRPDSSQHGHGRRQSVSRHPLSLL